MVANLFNVISVAAFFALGFGLLRFINRFETQWVSQDGLRFTARISLDSATQEKWHEVRVLIDGKTLIISGRSKKAKQFRGNWNLSYKADIQDDRRRHYVISRRDDPKVTGLLRVPATSRCVAELDALAEVN